ncbi:YIP1 family protein [Algiphilus sp.]|uniref:YIP1 family protein n=1 Tax=Algiphilus sp. TaxID=1872431 RepID=UPI001CA76457|nr:YIP1 family protein [Algiphilus sp.]MCI5061531.1 YIP1 family protein [Algiphilus sp.]MCI5102611.1 YIP1 family protein [Algiphilus sp.]MCR9091512.1 YIP1 family protein [Pseudomonadota bacterium]
MDQFVQRMIGAAKLDVATFESVEHDQNATLQALAVVVLVAVATGLGGMAAAGITGLIVGIVAAVIGWAIWAGLIWLIGTKLLPEESTEADWGQVARTTGFAQSPGLLRIFGFIPVVGPLVVLVASIWQLVAVVVAIRQALDYTQTWRAIVVVLIGWLINLAIFMLLGVNVTQ